MSVSRRKAAPLDTRGWLTRNEVAEMLGVSQQTIMNYETRKLLRPECVMRNIEGRGLRKVYLYGPDDVAKLPARARPAMLPSAGEIAARCFELFNEGRNLREVVTRVRVTPDQARELHEAWLDMGGTDIVITAVAKSAFEELLGSFEDVADLVELVRKRIR